MQNHSEINNKILSIEITHQPLAILEPVQAQKTVDTEK